jgi:hypothetical protein
MCCDINKVVFECTNCERLYECKGQTNKFFPELCLEREEFKGVRYNE